VALTIRVADLGTDREQIIETLRRHLTPLSDSSRFDWLYRSNPCGPASAWIAFDPNSGETVGMASAFPRRATWEGREVLCWVLGDFCIHERYRALGPALQLNRACLGAVDEGAAAFCFDFPSRGMMAVYRRMGITPSGTMTRFARVLRWDQKLRHAAPKLAWAAGIAGAIADRAAAPRWPKAPTGVSLAVSQTPCDASFDDLDRESRGRFRLYLERSAAYLNWRFRANPLADHEFLVARRDRKVIGYAVFTQEGAEATLVDLLAQADDIAALLLHDAAARLRSRGAATLSAPVSSSHPIVPLLLRSGFHPRETSPVVRYGRRGSEWSKPLDAGDWPLSYGDRDS
jgi:GNAT superfamily N-acetyltransferase